jgi:hypothetical protein
MAYARSLRSNHIPHCRCGRLYIKLANLSSYNQSVDHESTDYCPLKMSVLGVASSRYLCNLGVNVVNILLRSTHIVQKLRNHGFYLLLLNNSWFYTCRNVVIICMSQAFSSQGSFFGTHYIIELVLFNTFLDRFDPSRSILITTGRHSEKRRKNLLNKTY